MANIPPAMLATSAFGALVWGFVMPNILSTLVVSIVWGGMVAIFWIRNFPSKSMTPQPPVEIVKTSLHAEAVVVLGLFIGIVGLLAVMGGAHG